MICSSFVVGRVCNCCVGRGDLGVRAGYALVDGPVDYASNLGVNLYDYVGSGGDGAVSSASNADDGRCNGDDSEPHAHAGEARGRRRPTTVGVCPDLLVHQRCENGFERRHELAIVRPGRCPG